MAIVDDLLANPGLYIGADQLARSDHTGVARIVVTPLPGRSGVTLDYEVVNAATPESGRSHVEHTMIARTHGGGTIMVIGSTTPPATASAIGLMTPHRSQHQHGLSAQRARPRPRARGA